MTDEGPGRRRWWETAEGRAALLALGAAVALVALSCLAPGCVAPAVRRALGLP